VRGEARDDYQAILRLTYEAFLTLDYPGRERVDEHYLVHLFKGSDSVIRELCFVAETEGRIVGHILYTRSKVIRPGGEEKETITFGPLSVDPEYHRQGVGKKLTLHSMEKAREMGFGAVVIEGVPAYYPRLGSKRASDYGLTYADGSAPDHLMGYELRDRYLDGGGEVRFLAPEYEAAEKDVTGFEAFNTRFMAEYFSEK